MRGRIVIDLFSTLDGVVQAPGGPDEDRSDGFRFGGWQAPLVDEVVGAQISEGMTGLDALLLGRRTYDIFADYWPQYDGAESGSIARLFNRVPKYVASRGHPALMWRGSRLLGDDLLTEIDALRDAHREVHVVGSVDFAQTLFAAGLFDELKLWVHPVVLGQGKRVFPEGTVPANLRVTAPAVTTPRGVVLLRYAPVDHDVHVGTFD